MGMKSFYPKGNWVKRKSRIKESVESLIKWVFEKTVNKSRLTPLKSSENGHFQGGFAVGEKIHKLS